MTTVKELLLQVIKRRGLCPDDFICSNICLLWDDARGNPCAFSNAIQTFDLNLRYKNAINKFIELYGKEELLEVIL